MLDASAPGTWGLLRSLAAARCGFPRDRDGGLKLWEPAWPRLHAGGDVSAAHRQVVRHADIINDGPGRRREQRMGPVPPEYFRPRCAPGPGGFLTSPRSAAPVTPYAPAGPTGHSDPPGPLPLTPRSGPAQDRIRAPPLVRRRNVGR